jgi:hypothetical protein
MGIYIASIILDTDPRTKLIQNFDSLPPWARHEGMKRGKSKIQKLER